MSELLSSTRSGYQADVTVEGFKLRLLSYKGSRGWMGKIIDLKTLSYPFKGHHADDAEHGKVIAVQLAAVYAGQQPVEVVWKRIPTVATYN